MAVNVKSGPLRHPVWIQRATTTADDDTGEPIHSWVNWRAWWCALEPVTAASREKFTGSGLMEEAEYLVRMRYVPEMTRKDRIVMSDGRVLEILALADVMGRERMHEAVCKQTVS